MFRERACVCSTRVCTAAVVDVNCMLYIGGCWREHGERRTGLKGRGSESMEGRGRKASEGRKRRGGKRNAWKGGEWKGERDRNEEQGTEVKRREKECMEG